MRKIVMIFLTGTLAVLVLATAAGAGVAAVVGAGDAAPGDADPAVVGTDGAASEPSAVSGIPAAYLRAFQGAAATCPGLPWSVLAGIGRAETDFGADDHVSTAGAEGPMQFEPATFAAYDRPVPPGGANPPSPYDPTDAIYAAARDLCANGARDATNLDGAIYAYNHATWYVSEVLDFAQTYSQPQAKTVASGTAGSIAVDWALAQVGTPYVWGGETPGVGFDCSGLVQAAYRAAGITLPRTAQEQYDAGPAVPAGDSLEPGDLVFFGGSSQDVSHVGLYVGTEDGQAVMVDAPHTGADVRVEPFPTTIGARFGTTDLLVGFTRPADRA